MARIPGPAPDLTGLLIAWSDGDEAALERLMPLVQQELHAMARRYMARERRGHTLTPTELVNEAFLRLVDMRRLDWRGRSHFLALAARAMRRILVDYARARAYQKRGGGAVRVALADTVVGPADAAATLLALDDALEDLSRMDARKAQVIELRFFGGLSVQEAATALKVSEDTVMRDWRLAKAWLSRELRGSSA